MKRFLLSSMLIFMITLLAGCISIPIGDDVLEISEDGVKYYRGGPQETLGKKDGSDVDNNVDRLNESTETNSGLEDTNNDAAGNTENNDIDSGEKNSDDELNGTNNSSDPDSSGTKLDFGAISDSDLDKLQEMFDELKRIGEELSGRAPTESESAEKSNNNECEKGIDQDFSNIRNKLNHSFYFPECAELISVNDKGSTLEFVIREKLHFTTGSNNSDIYIAAAETIHEGYRKLARNNIISEYPNVAMAQGTIEFYLHDNKTGETHVHHQLKNGYIYIDVTYHYP